MATASHAAAFGTTETGWPLLLSECDSDSYDSRWLYSRLMLTRFAVVLTLLVVPSFAQTQPVSGELQVREALARFVHAFDDLDWETFRAAFDDNATVFYPRAFPERANGRAEFERTFKTVFEQIRGGQTAAPYMDIQPKEMKIQLFGNVAIATFHLEDRAGFVNRRTVVLNKSETGWKIVHLHASEVSVTTTQR
jgi:ketosteroid isomerase-like protein